MTPASKRLRYGTFVTFALAASAALAAGSPAWAARPTSNPSGKPAQTQTQTKPSNPSSSHAVETDQGVVQSVIGQSVVLKALDGSTLTVPVGSSTRILVDGKLGLLRDVKPGFVAVAKWKPGKTAQEFQAFDLSPKSGERLAIVRSVSANTVVVTGPNGGSVTIHANVRTRVFLDGKPSTLHSIDTGFTLVTSTTATKGKPAVELRFLSPS